MKIELKHLVGYLPYGLKGQMALNDKPFVTELTIADYLFKVDRGFKPILRPLSDLTVEHAESIRKEAIKINGDMSGFDYLRYDRYAHLFSWYSKEVAVLALDYWVVERLISWHYDVFGLIENNLAIDINALNENKITL